MSSETDQQPPVDSNKVTIEKEQEAKLRQKYPSLKGPGPASFLQKRLSKGAKYFDSGDYNMAKAKAQPVKQPVVDLPPPVITDATGDTIPTPETLATRKPSLVPSNLAKENTS